MQTTVACINVPNVTNVSENNMNFYSILLVSATTLMQPLSGLPAVEVRFETPCQTPNNQPGYCTEIQRCSILYNQVLKQHTEAYAFIKASSCGPVNEDLSHPKVCCGTYDNYIIQTRTDATSTTTTTTITPPPSPSSRNPLPKNCGVQEIALNNRIFGGTDSELGEFPWLVRLKHVNAFNFTSYGCSGFLIHRRFVLTAAHCIIAQELTPLGPLVEVVLGSHSDPEPCVNYDGQKECNEPLSVKVDTIVVHRNYEPRQHLHDIALIRLRHRVDETKFIKPICISYNSTDQKNLWISGWGRTEKDATSSVKQKVSVPRVDNESCAEKFRQVNMNIQSTQLCAGGVDGHDSCTGDSGGPLMAMVGENVWYAEGIVSYGAGCGRANWPAVYTNLPKYVNWIVENINTLNRRRRENVLRA